MQMCLETVRWQARSLRPRLRRSPVRCISPRYDDDDDDDDDDVVVVVVVVVVVMMMLL
jgi:hypothetical protein